MTKEEQKKLNDKLFHRSYTGNLKAIKNLIAKGAEFDAQDDQNRTPLHWAAEYGRLPVVMYLIETHRAKVDVRDILGQTPLFVASRSGHLDVVKYLVDVAKANVDLQTNDHETPIGSAFSYGHYAVETYLFLDCNALMSIYGILRSLSLVHRKMRRDTYAQSILDYFLQNKHRYKPEEIQDFKKKFLKFQRNEEDTQNLKSIVKFL